MTSVLPGENIHQAFHRIYMKNEVEKRYNEALARGENPDKKEVIKQVFSEVKDKYKDFKAKESRLIKDVVTTTTSTYLGITDQGAQIYQRQDGGITVVKKKEDGTTETIRTKQLVERGPRTPKKDADGNEIKAVNVWAAWMQARKPACDDLRKQDKSKASINAEIEEKYGKNSAAYKEFKNKWELDHPKKSAAATAGAAASK
jgi:hypothetical protein